ncbi:MAG: TonB-dependent receptor, partial [Muribaculaceae bacterium]|nr:TonB-dependent receptor [Muribaculaceae bacterium]
GKTLDFINGSCNINGSFSRSESNIIYDNHGVNSISTAWSAGAKISGSPASWLGIDYKFNFSSSRLAMNQSRASWLSSMQNEFLLNIIPATGWQWHISGEHYRNELTAGSYKNMFMLDTKVIYRLTKRLELSAALSNILNSRSYNYVTYSDISSFESQRRLRGRQLLFTISLRK